MLLGKGFEVWLRNLSYDSSSLPGSAFWRYGNAKFALIQRELPCTRKPTECGSLSPTFSDGNWLRSHYVYTVAQRKRRQEFQLPPLWGERLVRACPALGSYRVHTSPRRFV